MAYSVTFDMYVRTNNAWQNYERFIETERDDALQTARQLDREPDIQGVRIIRVTSFESGRAPLEALEWISPSLRKNASRDKAATRTAPPLPAGIRPDEDAPIAAERKRARNKTKKVFKIITIVALAGIVSAALFTPARYMISQLSEAGLLMPPLYQEIATFSTSVIVFLGLTIIGFTFFLTSDDPQDPNFTLPITPLGNIPSNAQSSAPEEEFLLANKMALHKPEPEILLTPMMGIREPSSFIEPNAENSAPQTAHEDEAPTDTATEENELLDQNRAPAPTSLDEDHRVSMLRFLESSLSKISDILTTLDSHTLLGINLILAGASDRFGAINDLNAIQRFILIRETIGALGTQPDQVDAFCEKFFEYEKDPIYRYMTEAGRSLLEGYLAHDSACFDPLPELIKHWRKTSSTIQKAQEIAVIMFTDLVGSERLPDNSDGADAQEIIRTHNVIVRNAVAQFHGEEMEHTGDGIMARFSNAPNSLRASIRIQRGIATHNETTPGLPIAVRIGLSASHHISEEVDSFDQTVQQAAVICNAADKDQIRVTSSVYELAHSHAFDFMEIEPDTLEGLDPPLKRYTVGWQSPESPRDSGSS